MNKLAILLFLFIIEACSYPSYPVDSPYFLIPIGTKLTLHQKLFIQPESGRTYIQYGKPITAKEKDKYTPHCWFTTWVISENETIIEPDIFIVTESTKEESIVQLHRPTVLASSLQVHRFGSDGGPTAIEYSTVLKIHSDKNPDIREFTCSHWEDPYDANHLTLQQINVTLGDIAELRLAD